MKVNNRINDNYKKFYKIIGSKIGKGQFGSVYKVKDIITNEIKAIKIIDLISNNEEDTELGIKSIINELNNMWICTNYNKNNYSVKLYEYFKYKKEFVIVMELCDDNLLKILKQRKQGFKPLEIYNIVSQLNNTFKIMVKNKIVHRDIKLENILIKYTDETKKNFIVKLTDYGISKQVTTTKICKTHAGTGTTMAPEILEGQQEYNNKCDLWSIGIIIYQLTFNEFPYIGNTEVALLNKIKQLGQMKFKSSGDENLDTLIKQLLVYDANKRIEWDVYFNHRFFASYRIKDDYRKYYEIIGEKIGKGAFGSVYKAKNKNTEELVAIKVIEIDTNNEDADNSIKNIDNELYYMKICSEKNNYSVKLYEYFNNGKEFVIVMELCDDNLLRVLNQRKGGFQPDKIYNIITQLNDTFKIMAKNKIVHRDIKLENILIKYNDNEKKDYIVKLTDYGISKKVEKTTMFKTHAGTRLTMAPEILEGKNYTNKCDLWSIGIIIYQLAFKEYPYKGTTEVVLLNKIKEAKKEHFKKTENIDLNNLIKQLLVYDENQRISWENYFNHPFFKVYKFNNTYNNFYEICDKIGKGSYGDVFRAKNKNTGELVALKKIYIDNNYTDEEIEDSIDLITKELKSMDICYNQNSVKLYDYFKNDEEIVIIMELCDDNLENILNHKKSFKIEQIYNIMCQLNNTFKIMAKNRIIHRDLKLENILVKYINKEKDDYIVKLTDYGVSRQVNTTQICKTFAGTPLTMAPEVLEGEGEKEYDCSKCDLWSIGIIIYRLFFNDYPYKGKTEFAILNNIKKLGLNILRKTKDITLDNLIQGLLTRDIRKRFSWEDYFSHPFFNKVKTTIIKEPEIQSSEITIKVKVSENDKKVYKKIFFLENESNDGILKFEDKFKELTQENTELYINGIKKDFKKYFEPTLEEGEEFIIKLIIKTKIKNCNSMFNGCLHIKSIDLSLFDSSEVENMSLMFCNCFNLENLNLGNIITEKVTNMRKMFEKCQNLKSINFPQTFTIKNVKDISFMFFDCKTLEEINLNFDTKNIENIEGLFKNCFLLKKKDLSPFQNNTIKKKPIKVEVILYDFNIMIEYIINKVVEYQPNNLFRLGLDTFLIKCDEKSIESIPQKLREKIVIKKDLNEQDKDKYIIINFPEKQLDSKISNFIIVSDLLNEILNTNLFQFTQDELNNIKSADPRTKITLIKIKIAESTKRYKDCLDIFIKQENQNLKENIYPWIEEKFQYFLEGINEEKNKKSNNEKKENVKDNRINLLTKDFNIFKEAIIDKAYELMKIEIDKTKRIIGKYFSNSEKYTIYKKLEKDSQVQFEFLEQLLYQPIEKMIEERNLDNIDLFKLYKENKDENEKNKKEKTIREEFNKLLLDQIHLLIVLKRKNDIIIYLKKNLKLYPNYPLREILDICILNKTSSPAIYILQSLGQNRKAFNLARYNLEETFNSYIHNLSNNENLMENLQFCINICINICKNESESSMKEEEYYEVEKLWFDLLGILYEFKDLVKKNKNRNLQESNKILMTTLQKEIEYLIKQMCLYIRINDLLGYAIEKQERALFKEFKLVIEYMFRENSGFERILQNTILIMEDCNENIKLTKKKVTSKGINYNYKKCDVCNKFFKNTTEEIIYLFPCGHQSHEKCCHQKIIKNEGENKFIVDNEEREVNYIPECEICRKNKIENRDENNINNIEYFIDEDIDKIKDKISSEETESFKIEKKDKLELINKYDYNYQKKLNNFY